MINRIYIFLLVVVAAMPYRFEYSLGPFSTLSILDMTLMVGIGLLCISMLRSGRIYLANSKVFLCISAPIFIAMLSLTWTSGIDTSIKYLIKIGFAFFIYLVLVNLGKTISERMIRTLWILFCCCCLIGSVGFYFGIPGFEWLAMEDASNLDTMASAYTRLGNPFIGRAPDYGPILAFCAFVMLGYTVIHHKKRYAMMAFVMIFAVILTLTRGIILGFFIALLIFAIATGVSVLRMIKITFIATILIGILATIIIENYNVNIDERTLDIKQVLQQRTSSANVDSRLEIYSLVLDKVSQSPFLGYGAGVFDFDDSGVEGDRIAAHNTYLQMLLFYGLPLGFISILVLLYHFYVYWKWPVISSPGRIMTTALSSAVIAVLISALTQPFLEASVPRVLFCFLMGLGTLTILAIERENRTVN